MKHLLVCREFPPSPGGGIGTYSLHIARLFAEAGETVHVITQSWTGHEAYDLRMKAQGIVVHRIPFEHPGILRKRELKNPSASNPEAVTLFRSGYFPEAFSWLAAPLIKRLASEHGIDLIEAPEYEAPLFHYFNSRSRGASSRDPVCIIHLHSPTEDIAYFNGWQPGAYAARAAVMESACIRAANAVISPSRFLMDSVTRRLELPDRLRTVIPYPLSGRLGVLPGAIDEECKVALFLGRLEGRKGVLEWIEAATEIARRRDDVRFEFLGEVAIDSGWRSGEEVLRKRIPDSLRSRFVFHRPVNRDRVKEFLARATFVAVPSRWDNFPNTCMEAMAAGRPVLTTTNGGMPEMVSEGKSGWISPGTGAQDLRLTLERALNTPRNALKEMGDHAAKAIGSLCDPGKIVKRHLEFRKSVVEATGRSSEMLVEVENDARRVWQGDRRFEITAEGGNPVSYVLRSLARRVRRWRAARSVPDS